MARAAQTFHVTDPETGRSVVYRGPGWDGEEHRQVGDEVPLEVAVRVGDHVLEWDEDEERPEPASPEGPAVDGEAFDQAVQAKVDETVAAAETAAVEAQKAKELEALETLTSADTFDPAGEGVTAQKVKDYLTGIDTSTAVGQWEYDRVVDAEKAGPNRSSAIPS